MAGCRKKASKVMHSLQWTLCQKERGYGSPTGQFLRCKMRIIIEENRFFYKKT